MVAVADAGVRFCERKSRNGDQRPEAFLADLRSLVDAVFKLNDTVFFENRRRSSGFESWRANKLLFAGEHMLAFIYAEGANYGAAHVQNWPRSAPDLQCLRDKFEALVERVVQWPKYMSKDRGFTGTLVNSFCDDDAQLQALREALTRTDGSSAWPNYQPGHTLYSVKIDVLDTIADDQEFIAWLPRVQLPTRDSEDGDGPPQDTARQSTEPMHRTDASASNERNIVLAALARGLIQQHVALRALLATCTRTPDHSLFKDFAKMVQLNETHSNPRSVLIFKCAWLVIAMADKLWKAIQRHESKGEIRGDWAENKPKLLARLESMTRLAVLTQVDAWREASRYERCRQAQAVVRYW